MNPRSIPAILIVAVTAGCLGGPLEPDPGGGGTVVTIPKAGLRVLFVGNSLTYSNDLPGVVAALAAESGRSFAHATVAAPNWSLEEHWYAGIADVIAAVEADVVVLQQGPSSLASSQAHLAYWTGRLAPIIRDAGGEPALLMVWPDASRAAFFPDVRDSYANAAAAVDGLFIPGGQTWVEAWELEPALAFWGGDGFHPAYLGTLAAAMAAYAILFDADPAAIPDLSGDWAPPGVVATLRLAVAAATATLGPPTVGDPASARPPTPGPPAP